MDKQNNDNASHTKIESKTTEIESGGDSTSSSSFESTLNVFNSLLTPNPSSDTDVITATATTTADSAKKQKTKCVDKVINSLAGEYVPLKSGKTNPSYGILHLYRDPNEIPKDNNNVSKNANDKVNNSQDSLNTNTNIIENNDDTILAVLAVPSYMSASDFLGFVASVRSDVSHFRFIRDSAPNKFVVLMKFRNSHVANDFYKQFNGQPFSSMEPEICHVAYIKSIEFKSTTISPYSFPFLHDPFLSSSQQENSTILHELPTCPVCLERMDASVTGLLTILCQHTFHCNCLSKWGDSSQKRGDYDTSSEQNECEVCGAIENLWICLICGNIGCGRYQEAHAHCHYKETSHLYAMELETQRVWDYAGDGYVHRLIQNKSDGKLVELPSPDSRNQSNQTHNDQNKLDEMAAEYTYLLTTQLSSQRTYYEEKIESLTKELSKLSNQVQLQSKEITNIKENMDKIQNQKDDLEKIKIPNLTKEKKNFEKKSENFMEKSKKLEKELMEEKEMTKSLVIKQQFLQEQLQSKDNKVNDLEEQIKDLMFYFSAQDKMKENPELIGGNILVSENNNGIGGGGSSRKKKGKK
nr:2056_t:CDS:2 [Entrophospora candida]CAG8480066.1 14720_t:CDS:2 [Entrophospora candida]